MPRWLCVLETMWGSRAGKAPPYFCISPRNHSGRRLYQLTGEKPGCLWCTNVCPELVTGPNHHGVPSVTWLASNLGKWLSYKTAEGPALLVCGSVAQRTFSQLPRPPYRTVYVPHPAARNWRAEHVGQVTLLLQGTASLNIRINRGELEVSPL